MPHRLFTLKLTDIAGIGTKMAARLAKDGVNDIEQLCSRAPRGAGTAWGGTDGDRLWYLLHGVDLPEKATQERTIGHSHVLAPRNRGCESARLVARRLVLKAASRLRAKDMAAKLLVLHVRFDDDRTKWKTSIKLPATQDSFPILRALDHIWPQLARVASARTGGFRLRMVGVTLMNLAPVAGDQGSLFERLDPDHELARALRTESLSRAMDRINQRFGRNAVMVGPQSGGRADRIGTSIAFGRIPEPAEFVS